MITRQQFIDTCEKYDLIMRINNDYDLPYVASKHRDDDRITIQTFTELPYKNSVGRNYCMKVCLSKIYNSNDWYVAWYDEVFMRKGYFDCGREKRMPIDSMIVEKLEQIISDCLNADKRLIREERRKKIDEI